MVIGSGMLAQAFNQYSNNNEVLIFASGVSNSQERNHEAYQREKTLLKDNLEKFQKSSFVYFSTCSIEDPSMKESHYVNHKREMEDIIKQVHQDFYIFRLPQVVGKTNSPTIIHFLYDKITTQEPFDIWVNSTRNLIDVHDIVKIVNFILRKSLYKNEIVNIASPFSINIQKIVTILERITNQESKYQLLNKGAAYTIDISKISPIISFTDIHFDENYIENIIKKYYSFNAIQKVNP